MTMEDFITAAKAVRDIFDRLAEELESEGVDLDIEIDQMRVVIPVGRKVGSHRIGELLARFDREHAALVAKRIIPTQMDLLEPKAA
jgi:hypothetical protein